MTKYVDLTNNNNLYSLYLCSLLSVTLKTLYKNSLCNCRKLQKISALPNYFQTGGRFEDLEGLTGSNRKSFDGTGNASKSAKIRRERPPVPSRLQRPCFSKICRKHKTNHDSCKKRKGIKET